MNQESITRGILAEIIDRYIEEIAEDPNRSIRKLVDMGEKTSSGATRKILYQMMQEMGTNQSSPYYEMIHQRVIRTAPETIKCYGINLGYNSWTFGARNMRRLLEKKEASIPWILMIDRTEESGRIPFETIRTLIQNGRKHEIYSFLFQTGDMLDEWEEYTDVFRICRDCAFGIILNPKALTNERIIEEIPEIPNLMILLNTDEPDWQESAQKLTDKGCLFSAIRTIKNAEQAEEVTSGSWFEELSPCYPLMAFTLADDQCPETAAESVRSYMWETRLNQLYPVLPANLITDFLIISRLVSHQEVLYRIAPDGCVFTAKGLRFVPSERTLDNLFEFNPQIV